MTLSGFHIPAGTHVDLNPVIIKSRIIPTRLITYCSFFTLSFFNSKKTVHFRDSQIFSDPDSHIPERWLREEEAVDPASDKSSELQSVVGTEDKIHPFLLTPFGHGTRMCAGRRWNL